MNTILPVNHLFHRSLAGEGGDTNPPAVSALNSSVHECHCLTKRGVAATGKPFHLPCEINHNALASLVCGLSGLKKFSQNQALTISQGFSHA